MKINSFDFIDIKEVTCYQNCFFSLHLTNLWKCCEQQIQKLALTYRYAVSEMLIMIVFKLQWDLC